MDYALLKMIHVTCVTLSISFFLVRGSWMLLESPMLQRRWVKILPHVIDTTLLTSAIFLAMTIHQYPGANPWLTAKLLALLAYIGLGTVAIKRGRSKLIRGGAGLAAVAVFAYIVAVALTRRPAPWEVLLGS